MKKLSYLLVLVLVGFLNLSCNNPDDDGLPENPCDDICIISASQFTDNESDYFLISDVKITDDCLEIEYSSSGCDGASWIPALIDANEIAESIPEQRRLRFTLDNKENCLAVFVKTVSFDISELKIGDTGEIILNLADWDNEIRYTY